MSFADLGGFLGAVAAIIQVAGYAVCLRGMLQHRIAPNSTSWLLWAAGSTVSLVIYSRVTSDPALLALPIACAASSIAIVAIAVLRDRLRRPDWIDLCIGALDIVVVGVWLIAGPVWGYAALLLDNVITHLPILRSTRKNPEGEMALPWLTWTMAYLLMLVAALLRQQDRDAYVFLLVCAVVSGAVWVLAARKRPSLNLEARPTRDATN